MELVLFCVLVGGAAVLLVRGARAAVAIALAAALVAGSAAAAVAWRARDDARRAAAAAARAPLPAPVTDRGYVSSDSCRACHPSEYASWHRSFHRTMTQPARGAAVRAPFAGETLRSDDDGRTYRLRRDGDTLWADISGVGARRVPMMTGSHHMEAFWLAGARGNQLVEFPFTWLFDDARWVPRRDVFLVGTEYAKQPSTWNRICVECHVTGGVPGFDAKLTVPQSRVAELGIACEACHGPAAAHVAANRDPFRRWSLHDSGAADATIVNPARLPPPRSAEVCGQCHGIACPPDGWLQHGLGFRPGDALADGKPILRLASLGASDCRAQIAADASFAPSRYWKDGVVRVSGREYNGLVESRCFSGGALACVSCHSMHDSDPNWQLTRGKDGDSACTQCHATISKNVAAHTHHAPGSTGSTCYNCHMPETTWGLLRAMRSHQITIPRVQDDVDAGRPNACNLCHLDRTLAWTADALARLWGTPAPTLDADERGTAAGALYIARGEAGVRAIAACAAAGHAAMAPFLVELLDDDYSAIRYTAIRSLRTIPGFADLAYDYVGSDESRWASQREARARLARIPDDGIQMSYSRGEFERLAAERDETDQMFLAE